MTRGESFVKNGESTHGHRSATSNSARCDLNKNCAVLKLHDMCHNPKCNCQKQINFTPKQYMLGGNGFKNTMKKIFKGSQTVWNSFLKPALNIVSPYKGMAVSAQTKNPKIGQATANKFRNITGGMFLSFTDMHGNGFL